MAKRRRVPRAYTRAAVRARHAREAARAEVLMGVAPEPKSIRQLRAEKAEADLAAAEYMLVRAMVRWLNQRKLVARYNKQKAASMYDWRKGIVPGDNGAIDPELNDEVPPA